MRIAPLVLAAIVVFPLLAAAQDPLVKQALQRIEKVEQAEPQAAAGDQRALASLLADLDWAQKRLNAVVKKDQAHADASKRCQAIRTKVEAKKSGPASTPSPDQPAAANLSYDAAALQHLDKEIGAATYNFDIVPANLWTDTGRRRAMERDLQALTKRIGQFPFAVADVQKVRDKVLALQAKFDAAVGKVVADQAAAGDVGAKVELLLHEKYQGRNLPSEPEQPYEAERLRTFLLAVQQLRDVDLPADVVFARAAMQNTAVDRQRAETLQHTVATEWPRRLGELQQQVAAKVQGAVADSQRHAAWLLATDAKDKDQITNRVLGRGAFAQQMEMLQRGAEAVAAAKVHDELAGPAFPPLPAAERQAQAELVQTAIVHLQALAVTALDAVRMPAAASTDPELLAIAEQTLKQPGYGVSAWQHLVINAPKVRRERREATVRRGAADTTVTGYHYVWDEFQVTTVEAKGAETWLFYNTLKLYHSGDSTTPIGRWILSRRFESTRILPENVGK